MCPAALNNQVHTLSRRLRSSRGRPTGDQAVGLLSKAFPEDCVQDLQVIASATHGANFIRHFWTTASAIGFSLDITALIAQANLLIPEGLLDFSRRSHHGCPEEGRPVEPAACRSFLVVLQDLKEPLKQRATGTGYDKAQPALKMLKGYYERRYMISAVSPGCYSGRNASRSPGAPR
jgi:hypothetical protein